MSLREAYAYSRDPMAFIARKLAAEGPLCRFGLMGMRIALVAEPEAILHVLKGNARAYAKGPILGNLREVFGQGLLTAEGEEWRRRRKASQPAFHQARVVGEYAAIVRAAAVRRFEGWRPGQVVDVPREMTALALEIVVRALFGTEAEAHREAIGRAFREVTDFFEYALTPWGHWLKRAPLPPRRKYLRAVGTLDAVLGEIRRAGAGPFEALFEGLGPREARDELMTLFIAGHETSAAALGFAAHLAALHPAVQAPSRIQGLIQETLRLYPPVWSIGRQALEDDRFGIRRGDLVLVPVWRIHRDPRFFPDPDRFRPERWRTPSPSESAAEPAPGTFLPFGLGPRVCIGAGFARMEMEIVLAELLARFRLAPEAPAADPLRLVGTLTARPRDGIRVRLGAPG